MPSQPGGYTDRLPEPPGVTDDEFRIRRANAMYGNVLGIPDVPAKVIPHHNIIHT